MLLSPSCIVHWCLAVVLSLLYCSLVFSCCSLPLVLFIGVRLLFSPSCIVHWCLAVVLSLLYCSLVFSCCSLVLPTGALLLSPLYYWRFVVVSVVLLALCCCLCCITGALLSLSVVLLAFCCCSLRLSCIVQWSFVVAHCLRYCLLTFYYCSVLYCFSSGFCCCFLLCCLLEFLFAPFFLYFVA